MIVLNHEEYKIAEILVETARKHSVITFTEIMQRVGIGRRYLGRYLENIGKKCIELGLPIITVLVVYKTNGQVGKGYKIFEPNYKKDPFLVEKNQKKVWTNSNWSKLL